MNRIGQPSAPGGRAGSIDEVLQRAMRALDENRPVEAEHFARQILDTDRRNAKAFYVLGSAMLMLGRPREAIAALEDAVRCGNDPESHTMLAIALRHAGKVEDAYARLRRAIKRKPPYAGAFLELGRLLASMGRCDESEEALMRGLDVAPMMPQLSIQLGHVYLRSRKFADAKAAFTRALAILPSSPEALFGIAQAHLQNGEHEAAVTYLRRYLTLNPADQDAWLKLGLCLLAVGQRDAGHDCLRNVARRGGEGFKRALSSLVKSSRGRFWLKPSDAARFLRNNGS